MVLEEFIRVEKGGSMTQEKAQERIGETIILVGVGIFYFGLFLLQSEIMTLVGCLAFLLGACVYLWGDRFGSIVWGMSWFAILAGDLSCVVGLAGLVSGARKQGLVCLGIGVVAMVLGLMWGVCLSPQE